MKTDIQMPEFNLPSKIKQFLNTLTTAFITVLLVHVILLAVYAFAMYDWSLVVSGFDFSQWSVLGRCLILIPYLVFPIVLAAVKVAGFSLSDVRNTLQRIKKLCTRQADKSED